MRYVDNNQITDPHLNLALEEFLLRQSRTVETLLLLYVNEPAVIVGRNQNVFEEVNPKFIKNENIHLIRRLSGGGTVYHDLGNLNYSFITEGQTNLHKFERVTEPIIRVLRDLGVAAEFRARSDIVVGQKKISGNAQYASRGRMLSHGTLLFDSDLEQLNRAIKPGKAEIESRAVPSVRSSVGNIRDLSPLTWTVDDLAQALLNGILGPGETPVYRLSNEDWRHIRLIAEERYKSWEWNIARSPKFNITRRGHISGGTIEVFMAIEKGLIKRVTLQGTPFAEQAGHRLAPVLENVRYDPVDLAKALHPLENERLFAWLSKEAFIDLLY